MIILGLDPGTLKTGYGLIKKLVKGFQILDFGCIKPPPKLPLADRYLIIYQGVEQLIDRFNPEAMAIETQFVGKNPRSALKLGMACASAMLAARSRKLEVYEYSACQAKNAVVGNGKASKYQIQATLQMLFELPTLPTPEDAADALALALCHFQKLTIHMDIKLC